MSDDLSRLEQTVGRYLLFGQIGAGGMAAVHVGRFVGPAGFSRLVAIKRLHPHLAKEREFVHSFLDEARIATRVNHPNVVSVHDVVIEGDEVLLVMEFVHGCSLAHLLSAERDAGRKVHPAIAGAIAADLLHGLHAAHTARDERGRPLGLVHRDVSPQNVLVGIDGIARVLDFGIAKALGRLQTTSNGAIKGKLAYMAPEQILGLEVSASTDIYAAAIVIWEMLAGERYFGAAAEHELIPKVMAPEVRHLPRELAAVDAILARALSPKPGERFASSQDFAIAIETTLEIASRAEVADWVKTAAAGQLALHADAIEAIERASVPAMPVATPVVVVVPSSTNMTSAAKSASDETTRTPTRRSAEANPPSAPAEPVKSGIPTDTTEGVVRTTDVTTDKRPVPTPAPARSRVATIAMVAGAAAVAVVATNALRSPSAASTGSVPPANTTTNASGAGEAELTRPTPPPERTTTIDPGTVTTGSSEPRPAATSKEGRPWPTRAPHQGATDAGAAPTPHVDAGKSVLDAPPDRK